jgi:hypothetical protein
VRHVGQQPAYYNQIRGQHGDRYADLTQAPAWAFGEGRSYTTVQYEDLVLEETTLTVSGTIVAHVTVRNTGARPALETVQVYVRDVVTSVSWTDKELKAYRQVHVAPGEAARVRLELPVADCSIVDAAGRRVVEPGEFELLGRAVVARQCVVRGRVHGDRGVGAAGRVCCPHRVSQPPRAAHPHRPTTEALRESTLRTRSRC